MFREKQDFVYKILGQQWIKQNRKYFFVGLLKAFRTAGWERRVWHAFSSSSSRTAFHGHHLGNVDLTTSFKVPLASPCLALPIGPAHKKGWPYTDFCQRISRPALTLQPSPKGFISFSWLKSKASGHLELNSRQPPSSHWVPVETLRPHQARARETFLKYKLGPVSDMAQQALAAKSGNLSLILGPIDCCHLTSMCKHTNK